MLCVFTYCKVVTWEAILFGGGGDYAFYRVLNSNWLLTTVR